MTKIYSQSKRIDTSTLSGLKKAERLQARGWLVISIERFTNIVTLVK